MAELVMGIGVPHTPFFPGIAKQQGDSSRMVGLFKRVRQELESTKPDLIVMLTSDHFVSFFFDNMPTFCIGAFEHADGPHELSRMMQQYRLQGSAGFAAGLVKYGIENDFDLASSEEVKLDHATLVPLHFLTPEMKIPVVPIFIKALVEPLPRAQRCLALGHMIRRYIEQRPETERVAMIASGSFSLEVGGPRMGFVNKEWHAFVVECLRRGDIDELVRKATSENMRAAGNTGGELLLWIAMMGALGACRLKFIEPDGSPPDAPRDIHAYAVWEVVS
jgi:aromatic ring-opening dioxygenase catalytic subunit (LigB family)